MHIIFVGYFNSLQFWVNQRLIKTSHCVQVDEKEGFFV